MNATPGTTGTVQDAVIVNVGDLDDSTFGRLYDEVLAPSFPPDELLGEEIVRAQYSGDDSTFFGYAVVHGGLVVAAALCEYHEPSGISMLNYLAVRPGVRQGGHGGRLLRHVLSQWETMSTSVAILAEVEDPRHHGSTDHGDPVARLRFYERHGATVLPLPYFQPALGPGLARVPNLLLLSLRARVAGVPSAGLARFLDDTMAACEGEDAKNHEPGYRALRDRITAWPDLVPVLPLSRLAEIPPATDVPGEPAT